MNMKMRYFSLKKVLAALAVLTACVFTHAADPKAWDEAYAKDSPLDAAVADLMSEINAPASSPSFGSLKKIYTNVYASVPAIRKTQAQLNGLSLAVEEKESKRYPQVTLQSYVGRSTADTASASASGQARNIALEVNQLLFDFGATEKEIGAAKTRFSSGIDRVTAERMTVLLSMLKAQLELQTARKLIVFHDSNEKSRQQFYDLIKQKENLGASSKLDLARAETKLFEAKAKMPAITGDLFRAESAVKELFGVVPEFSFSFYQLPDIPVNFGGNIDDLVSRHPLVREAAKNFDVALQDVEYIKRSGLGRVSLTISSADAKQPVTGKTNTTSGYIEYSNVLFDGFAQKARIASAIEKASEIEIEKERIERNVSQQLLATLTQFQSAKETLGVRGKLLVSARKSARDLYAAFLLNRGSLSDVFDAEEAYFSATESTVNAMFTLYSAYYKLLHDMGQLSEAFELNS